MIYYMKLDSIPFDLIKNGSKTIEMRLNYGNRSKIKTDDIVEFENNKSEEILKCKVIKLYFYRDFEELYKNHNKFSLGYKKNEEADYRDMYKYYSKEQIDKYGVIGIELKLIK